MSFAQAIIDIYGNEIPSDGEYLSKYGGVVLGSLDMNQHAITDLPDPVTSLDVANKHYVDNAVSGYAGGNYVLKSGDTMTGNLIMSQNRITSLADPVNAQDASNKEYADSLVHGSNYHMPAYGPSGLRDTSLVEIDGRFMIGVVPPGNSGYYRLHDFQIYTDTYPFGVARFSNDAVPAIIEIGKSRSTTVGGYSTVNTGDSLGQLGFSGNNGFQFVPAARIEAVCNTNPTAGCIPTYINVYTGNSDSINKTIGE